MMSTDLASYSTQQHEPPHCRILNIPELLHADAGGTAVKYQVGILGGCAIGCAGVTCLVSKLQHTLPCHTITPQVGGQLKCSGVGQWRSAIAVIPVGVEWSCDVVLPLSHIPSLYTTHHAGRPACSPTVDACTSTFCSKQAGVKEDASSPLKRQMRTMERPM